MRMDPDPAPRPAAAGQLRALRALLPGREDYRGFPRTLRADLPAGITVGIVALPLALAFGVSSGAGAAAGLAVSLLTKGPEVRLKAGTAFGIQLTKPLTVSESFLSPTTPTQ